MGMVDNWLSSALKWATKTIGAFIAFLFFVFTAGMLFALYISQIDPVFLFLPPAMGLLAYYNEKIALLLFAGLLIFFVL